MTALFTAVATKLRLTGHRAQVRLAWAMLIAHIGISVTGSIVRVTASGLGCASWPTCHEDSFVPVSGAAPAFHQAVEFGNRLLTFVLVAIAAAIVLSVVGAARRRQVILLSWTMPAGVIFQAVLGGITVWLGLIWWTVAMHLLASMILVWIAAVLLARIKEDDDAPLEKTYPTPLRVLAGLIAVVSLGTIVSGTMVTGAGPHAGDDRIEPGDRLSIAIDSLIQLHAEFVVAYVALSVGLLCAAWAITTHRRIRRSLMILLTILGFQTCVGIAQYVLKVPEGLVVVHVGGAGATVAITAYVYALGRMRALKAETS